MDYGFLGYKTKELMKKTKGGKFARKVVRNQLKKQYAQMTHSGPSAIAEEKLAPRRERRALARANKVEFEPVLNM